LYSDPAPTTIDKIFGVNPAATLVLYVPANCFSEEQEIVVADAAPDAISNNAIINGCFIVLTPPFRGALL
jgi:hypothetical protein